jgi:intracellular sulfur oxidation DsrE/DsrF family protein
MKRLLPVLVLALAGCAATAQTQAPPAAAAAGAKPTVGVGPTVAGMSEMKMAFDLTDGNPQKLILQLTVIDLTRRQLVEAGVTPKIVVGFRGDASYYTQTNLSKVKEADRADALKIRSMLRNLARAPGIESMEQCNVPLASRKLDSADLMQEVKLVGNGWVSLVAYQHKGYGYIAP